MPTSNHTAKDLTETLTQALEAAAALSDEELAATRAALEAEAKRRTLPPPVRKASGTFLKAPTPATVVPAVVEEIYDKEGFRVEIPGAEPGLSLPPYAFQRRMRGDATVQHWAALRWARFYGQRAVKVLLGDGRAAPSNMRLENVVESYRGRKPPEEKF